MIEVTRAIAPTFGGINTEDIKSPECFYIETRLKEMLDIPVFTMINGTAIISGAAILNAMEITGKKFENTKVVFPAQGVSHFLRAAAGDAGF